MNRLNDLQSDEERLQILLSDVYAAEPTDDLRRRIAGLAATARVDRPAPWRYRVALAAAAMAAAVLLVFLWPQWVGAREVGRMAASLSGVRSAFMVMHTVAVGSMPADTRRTWYQDGRWRFDDTNARTVQLFADGRFWNYAAAANRVTVQREASAFAYSPTGFTMDAINRDSRHWGAFQRMRKLPDAIVNGRLVHVVSISDGETSVKYFVDPATDLPMRADISARIDGVWRLNGTEQFVFNRSLKTGIFQPNFPKSARVVDLAQERQTLYARLSHGLVRKVVGGRVVAIRDFQVNDQGDVFLLYSAGKHRGDTFNSGRYMAGRDWLVDIHDQFGTKYTWMEGGGFQADTRQMGYAFRGDKLEGDWWAPQAVPGPWRPRRFTITFRVNHHNLHGAVGSPNITCTDVATFPLDVRGPSCAVVPDYLADLPFDYLDEKTVIAGHDEVNGVLPADVHASQELLANLKVGTDGIDRLAFTPDGSRLAAGCWTSVATLYDTGTGKRLRPLSDIPGTVIFSQSGKLYAVIEYDGGKDSEGHRIVIGSASTGKIVRTFSWPGRDGDPVTAVFSPDDATLTVATIISLKTSVEQGRVVVDMSQPGIRRWDVASGRVLLTRTYPQQAWSGMQAFTPNGDLLVGNPASGNSDMALWNTDASATAPARTYIPPCTLMAGYIGASADGRIVAYGGMMGDSNGRVRNVRAVVWDAGTGRLLHQLYGPSIVNAIAISPDGHWVACAEQDNTVVLWDIQRDQLARTLIGHARMPIGVAFSPDGKMLASGDIGGNVILWRVP